VELHLNWLFITTAESFIGVKNMILVSIIGGGIYEMDVTYKFAKVTEQEVIILLSPTTIFLLEV
jgi:hypothetical protein